MSPDPAPRPPAPRRVDGLFALLRRLSRLWGFLLFLVFTAVLFREVVVPFIFAFALAYLLAPIIRRMEPRIGRVVAVIIVYLGVFAAVGAFVGILLPALIQDFARLRDAAPEIVAYVDEKLVPRVSGWISDSFGSIDAGADAPVGGGPPPEGPLARTPDLIARPLADGSWQISLEGVRLHVEETGRGSWEIAAPTEHADTLGGTLRKLAATKGSEYTGMIAEGLRALISGVTSFMTKFVITLMLAAFILVDPRRISGFLRSIVPAAYQGDVEELLRRIDVGLSGVIRGQLLICLVNGVLTWIGLMVVGVKYSFLLAVIAGVFSLIPIFGTIVSSIPIMVVALVSSEGGVAIGPPLLMLAWISGIHLLEANVLNPKIIGDSAHMHPVIVVFALLAGEHVYGLTGALLAVPVANVVQTIYLYMLRNSEAFLRSRPAADASAVALIEGDE